MSFRLEYLSEKTSKFWDFFSSNFRCFYINWLNSAHRMNDVGSKRTSNVLPLRSDIVTTHTIKTTNQKPLTDYSKWTLNHFVINVWISSLNGSINIFFSSNEHLSVGIVIVIFAFVLKICDLKKKKPQKCWISANLNFDSKFSVAHRIYGVNCYIGVCVIVAWWKKNSIFVVAGGEFGSSSISIF